MAKALYKETADDPLGARLYLTAYRVLRHADQILGSYGLTFHSYLMLYYVDKIPRINMKELCEYLDVSQSIVSRSVQTLESKSLLRRSTASDKRKTELVLTPEARRKLRKASGQLNELSFVMRHQPDFRIVEIQSQLERIQKAVSIVKSRPILKISSSDEKGDSVMVRIKQKIGSPLS